MSADEKQARFVLHLVTHPDLALTFDAAVRLAKTAEAAVAAGVPDEARDVLAFEAAVEAVVSSAQDRAPKPGRPS